MKKFGPYTFPTLMGLSRFSGRDAEQMPVVQDNAAIKEAIARGYADGFAQGRAEAEAAAKVTIGAVREAAVAEGRAEGFAQMRQAAAALTNALAGFEDERAGLARECESFCVDISLAAVARLMETSAARAEFVTRAIAAALKVLAPAPPSAIFLNPADRALVQDAFAGLALKDDETLAPGQARVEAGRLLVEAGIEQAFEQIKSAVLEVRTRRNGAISDLGDKR